MPKRSRETIPPTDPRWLDALPPISVSTERLADAVWLAACRRAAQHGDRRSLTAAAARNRAVLLLVRYGGERIESSSTLDPRCLALITDTVSMLKHLTDFDRHHFGVCMGGDRLSALVFGRDEYPGPASASVAAFFDKTAERD